MRANKDHINIYPDLYLCIEKYFTRYLAAECNASKHTIRSYRDTWMHFLEYMKECNHIGVEKLKLEQLDKDTVLHFLDWLQTKFKNSSATRNLRLASIKSFCNFMVYEDPVHISQWVEIVRIRPHKSKSDDIRYLTVEGMELLFKQIPTDTKQGRRDMTMLYTLYNLALRASELTHLTPSCIRISRPYIATILGKGAKKRIVPVDDTLYKIIYQYMDEFQLNTSGRTEHWLFSNCYGGILTDTGIRYIINKYADMARKDNPNLIPMNIGPHDFRRSRAMHWLEAGIDIFYIKDLLGHVSIDTTQRYARADSKMKRKALEEAYIDIGIEEPNEKSWTKDPKLMKYLKGLSKQ